MKYSLVFILSYLMLTMLIQQVHPTQNMKSSITTGSKSNVSSKNLKSSAKLMTGNSQYLADTIKTLFTSPRDSSCAKEIVINQIGGRINKFQDSGSLIDPRYSGWIKNWGYGESAFVFDYLDPMLGKIVVEEFERIYTTISKLNKLVYKGYTDPFLSGFIDTEDKDSKQKLQLQLAENVDPKVAAASVNAVQMKQAMENFYWNMDKTAKDPYVKFINQFDVNNDLKLSPRELILGAITTNKAKFGISACTFCFENVIPIVDSIFSYIDCDGDGKITAENLAEFLPKLNRKDKRWDIFALKVTGVRTKSLNDFILMNSEVSLGELTKEEFRDAILYGFWNRQTSDLKILTDTSRSLKHLRWKDNDTVDKEAERHLVYMAEMKKKKQEEEFKNLNPRI